MVVTCEHCGARYRLDKGRIQGRGARITCPQCRHVFVVYQEGEGAPVETKAIAEDRPTDVQSLDFKSVGISTWKVKTGIGLVYDFSDFGTLRKYLKEGRVSTDDHLSHDGVAWQTIGEVADLEAHFIDTYVAARTHQKASARAEVEAEKAVIDAVDADAIAGDLLDRIATAEEPKVEVPEESEAPEEPEESEAPAATEGDIADQLLAAVEAAANDDAETDDGIELDMDALLEAAGVAEQKEKAPPSARRGAEQKAVGAVPKTGSEDKNPHQFVDPFEALKQSRQVRTSDKTRRVSKKQAAQAAEVSAKQRKQLIMAGLLLCSAAAYFGIDRAADEGPSPGQVQQAVRKAEAEAQEAVLQKRAEEARARMQDNLNKALKDVKVEEIDAFTVEEDQLIVRVPDAFKKGAVGTIPTGRPPDAPGYQTERDVTQRALSAQDHFAMGQAAVRAQRWVEASGAFKSALELAPSNAAFRARLGFSLYKQGDLEGAETELRKAASAGAVSAGKYLGHMAREQGDIAGANSHYQAYLRSDPADAKAIEIMIQQMTP
jgi:predicted Zn finger-like uncharacterized protein